MTEFLPEGFKAPPVLEAGAFRMRPVTINDVIKDYYDAVMTSRERLWGGRRDRRLQPHPLRPVRRPGRHQLPDQRRPPDAG